MISCAEAVHRLWEYLDGVVDDSQRAAIEEHLAFCRRCCGEMEFAEELRSFLGSHADNELSPVIHARLLTALDEVVDQR
jgi:mycothiol system anti-sigma-R factor